MTIDTSAERLLPAPPRGASSALLLAGLGALGTIVSLGIVFSRLAAEGHAAFGTSNNVPWGLPVATYVFFVLTSTGLTFVASLAMVFGFAPFYPIAKRCVWLAVATLVAGFAALALELGHPFRMLWSLPFSFQVTSAMWWMGVFYALYLVLLLLKFAKMQQGDWHGPASRRFGVASFVVVILAHGTLGAVFGMMAMRPFWYDGLIPVYFLVTAAVSGVAFAILFTQLAYGFSTETMPLALHRLMEEVMPKLFAAVLGAGILFVAARTITGLWSNLEGLEVFRAMVASPLFHFELWVGLVLPFALMLSPEHRRRPGIQALAAVLVAAALFIGRYEFVIGGQIVPLFKGLHVADFASYAPSLTEWMLVVLAASVTLLIYGVGQRLFRLEDTGA